MGREREIHLTFYFQLHILVGESEERELEKKTRA